MRSDLLENILKASFVRILIFFLTGFFAFKFLQIKSLDYIFIGISISILISLICYRFKLYIFVLFFTCFSSAYIFAYLNFKPINEISHNTPEFNSSIRGEIKEVLFSKNKTKRIIVDAEVNPYFCKSFKSNVIINIFHDSLDKFKLNKGDKILSNGIIQLAEDGVLETDFPEQIFFKNIKVDFKANINQKNFAILESNQNKNWSDISLESINSKINQLYQNEYNAIVKALVLGNQKEISQDTKNIYSYTGTSHVLSVSGLHVGIIALIIYTFLSLVKNRNFKFILFSIIVITFVFLSGLQAAAVRAGIMSIVAAFIFINNRRVNAINILAFTAFVYILIDATILYSVSFQLSVAALLSILIFSKSIEKVIDQIHLVKNKFLKDYLISPLAITFAVAIFTAPLTAYYFNLFSFSTFFANIFIIPLMTLAMVFSLISICFSYIYFPIAELFKLNTMFLIDLSDLINKYFSTFSWSFIKNQYVIILALSSSFTIVYMLLSDNKLKFYLRFANSSILIIFSIFIMNYLDYTERQKSIKIFEKQKYVLINFKNQSENIESFFVIDRKKYKFHSLDNSLINFFVNKSNEEPKKQILIYSNWKSGDKLKSKLDSNKFAFNKLNIEQVAYLSNKLKISPSIFQYEND